MALARILLKNPSFYLLDEAFSAMDVDTRQELEQYLLNQKYSIISISHTYTKEILSQYDQIIVMQQAEFWNAVRTKVCRTEQKRISGLMYYSNHFGIIHFR